MTIFELPSHEDVVVSYLVQRNADDAPDEVFITFEDGTTWTRAEARDQMYASANALRAAGIRQGDHVGVLLPNGAGFLRAWWGINALGAVIMPIHTAFHGPALAHVLELGRPAIVVTESECIDRLNSVGYPAGQITEISKLECGDVGAPTLEQPLRQWDIAALILTSGTTGPSKLSATTNLHIYISAAALIVNWAGPSQDVVLADLPLFHLTGLFLIVGSLVGRARLAVRTTPALSTYWEVARDTGATVAILLSTMVPYLLSQPARPADREHRLRLLMVAPLPTDLAGFIDRFHIAELLTAYGCTEVPGALGRTPDQPLVAGYCGRPRRGFDVRLVDEHDIEVPVGEVGQVIVRTAQPWMLSAGYVNDPAATAAAWRNGWFHTGDLLRRDNDDNYFFVDREKDALRRRGENISAFEVEAQVVLFPGVAEAACVAERDGAGADDEVKVWIVPSPGAQINCAELLRHCVDRLPYFAVPRYFELIDELPKTASARVQKYLLRGRGGSPQTWDRERNGIQMTRLGPAQI